MGECKALTINTKLANDIGFAKYSCGENFEEYAVIEEQMEKLYEYMSEKENEWLIEYGKRCEAYQGPRFDQGMHASQWQHKVWAGQLAQLCKEYQDIFGEAKEAIHTHDRQLETIYNAAERAYNQAIQAGKEDTEAVLVAQSMADSEFQRLQPMMALQDTFERCHERQLSLDKPNIPAPQGSTLSNPASSLAQGLSQDTDTGFTPPSGTDTSGNDQGFDVAATSGDSQAITLGNNYASGTAGSAHNLVPGFIPPTASASTGTGIGVGRFDHTTPIAIAQPRHDLPQGLRCPSARGNSYPNGVGKNKPYPTLKPTQKSILTGRLTSNRANQLINEISHTTTNDHIALAHTILASIRQTYYQETNQKTSTFELPLAIALARNKHTNALTSYYFTGITQGFIDVPLILCTNPYYVLADKYDWIYEPTLMALTPAGQAQEIFHRAHHDYEPLAIVTSGPVPDPSFTRFPVHYQSIDHLTALIMTNKLFHPNIHPLEQTNPDMIMTANTIGENKALALDIITETLTHQPTPQNDTIYQQLITLNTQYGKNTPQYYNAITQIFQPLYQQAHTELTTHTLHPELANHTKNNPTLLQTTHHIATNHLTQAHHYITLHGIYQAATQGNIPNTCYTALNLTLPPQNINYHLRNWQAQQLTKKH